MGLYNSLIYLTEAGYSPVTGVATDVIDAIPVYLFSINNYIARKPRE